MHPSFIGVLSLHRTWYPTSRDVSLWMLSCQVVLMYAGMNRTAGAAFGQREGRVGNFRFDAVRVIARERAVTGIHSIRVRK